MKVSIIKFDPEKKYYVYVWYYKETNKVFYVGKGCKYRYRSRKRDNKKLTDIINNYECESRIVKGNLSEEEAFELEKEKIAEYRNSGHPLINILDGGPLPPNSKGKIRSEITKTKMSESRKKYFIENPDAKKKCSESMKKFLKSDKGKEFMEKSLTARRTQEFRNSQAVRSKATNRTAEYIARQSEIARKTWESPEYIEAHSGANNCRAEAVKQFDLSHGFIAEFPTMTEASKATGIHVSKISAVARGDRKTAGGYIWEYSITREIIHKKRSFIYDIEKDTTVKGIIQYDLNGNFVAEYKSISEATKKNDFPCRTNITQNLRGKTKSAYGYMWKYKQDNIVPSL